MNYKSVSLKNLKFAERELEKIKSENKSSNKFGWGIVYGLIVGILGNLYITILYDSWLKDFSDIVKVVLIILGTILICLAIRMTLKDDKIFKEKDKEIDEELDQIRTHIENIENEVKKDE